MFCNPLLDSCRLNNNLKYVSVEHLLRAVLHLNCLHLAMRGRMNINGEQLVDEKHKSQSHALDLISCPQHQTSFLQVYSVVFQFSL